MSKSSCKKLLRKIQRKEKRKTRPPHPNKVYKCYMNLRRVVDKKLLTSPQQGLKSLEFDSEEAGEVSALYVYTDGYKRCACIRKCVC